jgi:hypothetical protein
MLAFKGVVLKVGPPQEVEIEDGFNWVCNGAALMELSKPARVYLHSGGTKYLLCTLSNNQPQYTLALVLPDTPFDSDEPVSLSLESENPKAEVHITGVLNLQEGPGDMDGIMGSDDESGSQSGSEDVSESGSDEVDEAAIKKLALQAASARPADKKDGKVEAVKAAPAKGAQKTQPKAAPKAQPKAAPAKGPAKAQQKESSSDEEDSSEGSDSGSEGSDSESGDVNLPEISSEESSEEKPKKKVAAPNTPSQKPKGPTTPGKGPATPGQKPKGASTPGQKPKGPATPGGAGITCFKCGKPGHKSPQCPQASPAGNKTPGGGPGEKRKTEGAGGNAKKFKK